MKKLFLLDGHALIFKMYYAFAGRPMINTKGVDTSILFGFMKYLLEMIERENPSCVAVSFDPPGGTFRNQLYPDYKANRGETPQLVIDALEPLCGLLKAMDIPVLMLPGFEADDVIGSAAKRFSREGFEVYMVTPDKDYGQLVEPSIFQYKPGKAGGENEILDPAGICAKWGIDRPSQVIDILAICGDSSDNVPGVQGVGPVGAAKLLAKYGSMEEIYAHIGELTPRQQDLFRAAEGHIALSKTLVTIKTDIPLDVRADDLALSTTCTPELLGLFSEYEFNSLKRKLIALFPAPASNPSGSSESEENAPAFTPQPSEVPAADFRCSDGRMAVCIDAGTLYVATSRSTSKGAPAQFKSFLENESIVKCGAGLKNVALELSRDYGISLGGRLEDAELMHYVLNPERSHKLEALAASYLGIELDVPAEEVAPASLFDEVPESSGPDFLRRVWAAFLLCGKLSSELSSEPRLLRLYREIEEPLILVLKDMEQTGVRIDVASLEDYAGSLRREMAEQEKLVRSFAGDDALNVSSPKQIGALIYETLKLDPKAKKPKNGNWPTDENSLLELGDRTGVVDAILEYRGLRKLLSTYIEPFPGYISPRDSRVHTTFNQALTSTGRLSSSNPNLQNIPVRSERGREIRKAFVAGSPDSVMMSADYSQIELRIMAHLSGDEHLLAAFHSGVDVHSATAAKIFGVAPDAVTPDQRRVAKTANFGIMYGISSFGLSQRLKCSRSEAKKIIDDYFESFPSIRGFIDDTLAGARRDGYVETIFGRRRYIPDIGSHNANVRAVAERNAVNAPIQGSSADIIKIAMARVAARLRSENLSSKMVLQIHDELLLEVPRKEIEQVKSLLVWEMENVIELSVPFTVECAYADNWLEAH